MMINFKKIEISDKQQIDRLVSAANLRSSHYGFSNLFAWAEIYQYRLAWLEGFLVVKGNDPAGGRYYFYPLGQGDPTAVLRAMAEDAAAAGDELVLAGIAKDDMAVLDRLFPGKFAYTERRDAFDYIYLLEKLVTLSGDKLHAKRNHINFFKKHQDWRFEAISAANQAECWEMNKIWCKLHGCVHDAQLDYEKCAVRRCFDHFIELGLEGGALRVDGRIIAYTIGDKICPDTFDIHVEKAFDEFRGAYQMINREFAALIKENHPEVIYVNREEDMGIEGLRKAKLSYYPAMLVEKYWARVLCSSILP